MKLGEDHLAWLVRTSFPPTPVISSHRIDWCTFLSLGFFLAKTSPDSKNTMEKLESFLVIRESK